MYLYPLALSPSYFYDCIYVTYQIFVMILFSLDILKPLNLLQVLITLYSVYK